MRGDFDVLDPGTGLAVCVFLLRVDEVGGDGIADGEWFELVRGFDVVGHGHGFHESGDVVAVDYNGVGLDVDGEDTAGELVVFRGGGVVAGRESECGGQGHENKLTTIAGRIHFYQFKPGRGFVPLERSCFFRRFADALLNQPLALHRLSKMALLRSEIYEIFVANRSRLSLARAVHFGDFFF